jgi:hypothetical protein
MLQKRVRAGAEAYARRKGVTPEQFLAGFGKPLSAHVFGEYVASILTEPQYEEARQYTAVTILTGRRNMPAFGAKHAIGFGGAPATLTVEQIAAVINYVRTHFGNRYTDSITATEVAALDQSLR